MAWNDLPRSDLLPCQQCGEMKDDVKFVENPYLKDIHNEQVIEPLCENCYNLIADDI